MLCQNCAKVVPKFCKSCGNVWQKMWHFFFKSYANVMQMLCHCCAKIVQKLCKSCPNVMLISGQRWAKVVPKLCWCADVVPMFCQCCARLVSMLCQCCPKDVPMLCRQTQRVTDYVLEMPTHLKMSIYVQQGHITWTHIDIDRPNWSLNHPHTHPPTME